MKGSYAFLSNQGRRFGRRNMLNATALSAAGLSVSSLLTTCNTTTGYSQASVAEGHFPPHPQWHFVVICHVTTNQFFIPTQYGIQDATTLLGCTFQWTGSLDNNVADMVDAFDAAINAKADGIAVVIIDPTAFDDPIRRALNAGIPVVTYNADAPASSKSSRLAYVGQDLFASGQQLGQRIVELIPEGDVVGFIATSGSLNLLPRIEGAKKAIQDSGKPINFTQIETSTDTTVETARIEAYYLSNKHIKGMFAVDAGSTQSLAQIMEKYSLAAQGIHAGGYDVLPQTLQEIQKGNLDFTIDQQAYLQGFLPVVQLFLYKLSGGLLQPSNTDTGHHFVTKDNVNAYLSTKTRFEGSSSKMTLVTHA